MKIFIQINYYVMTMEKQWNSVHICNAMPACTLMKGNQGTHATDKQMVLQPPNDLYIPSDILTLHTPTHPVQQFNKFSSLSAFNLLQQR